MGVTFDRLDAFVRGRLLLDKGQMTVELAVALPILLVVALVAVNAGLLFSECATFDRVARNMVRVYAASPSYGQDAGSIAFSVEEAIEKAMGLEDGEVSVTVQESSLGHDAYTVRLVFRPTFFGMSFRSDLWGVSFPEVHHEAVFVVDRYKPGIVI